MKVEEKIKIISENYYLYDYIQLGKLVEMNPLDTYNFAKRKGIIEIKESSDFINDIVNSYNGTNLQELKDKYGLSIEMIANILYKNKVFKNSRAKDWSENEIKILNKYYGKVSINDICGMLPLRTKHAIHKYISKKKVLSKGKYTWYSEEEQFMNEFLDKYFFYINYSKLYSLCSDKDITFDKLKNTINYMVKNSSIKNGLCELIWGINRFWKENGIERTKNHFIVKMGRIAKTKNLDLSLIKKEDTYTEEDKFFIMEKAKSSYLLPIYNEFYSKTSSATFYGFCRKNNIRSFIPSIEYENEVKNTFRSNMDTMTYEEIHDKYYPDMPMNVFLNICENI